MPKKKEKPKHYEIESFRFFKDLKSPHLKSLFSTRSYQIYKYDEEIPFFKNGSNTIVCICSGAVKYTLNGPYFTDLPLQLIPPGNLTGLFDSDEVRLVSISNKTEVVHLDFEIFNLIRDKIPDIDKRTIEHLKKKIVKLQDRIALLLRGSARQVVSSTLLSLATDFGRPIENRIDIDIKLDRKSMAIMCGTVPETLARIFSDFEREKIINRAGRAISITNLEKLKKYSYA